MNKILLDAVKVFMEKFHIKGDPEKIAKLINEIAREKSKGGAYYMSDDEALEIMRNFDRISKERAEKKEKEEKKEKKDSPVAKPKEAKQTIAKPKKESKEESVVMEQVSFWD